MEAAQATEQPVTASVRKVGHIGDALDAPSQLPSYRTTQERPSPGPGQRKGNIGPRPRANSNGDPFIAPTGPAPSVTSEISFPAIGAEPASRRSTQCEEHNWDCSVSPTLSRARSHGLNTGRDGTDVDNLEDGEVREYLGNGAEQEEDALMLDASAGGGTGAGDDNGDTIIPDNKDADDSRAQPNPEPQQGQNYAAIAAAAQGNGLHPQVYLFANAPAPAPAPAPHYPSL
ncbi:hypothetical protein B0H13DRAFT_2488835 [Mycena leptocephala]|nr:hypothetical protein B0H13DRAFT_2488835 [Mycena leptocephala]